jgi:hypothetical protein
MGSRGMNDRLPYDDERAARVPRWAKVVGIAVLVVVVLLVVMMLIVGGGGHNPPSHGLGLGGVPADRSARGV